MESERGQSFGTCDATISFDGGETWQEIDGRDLRVDALAEPFDTDTHTCRKLQVYASAQLKGTFRLKPQKARKERQTPPFWSAYK